MKIFSMKLLPLCLFFICYVPVFAQKDVKKYKEEANAVRQQVWGWDKPEFAVRSIPAQYANASRVVIARHFEINTDSKKKAKFTGLGFAVYSQLTHTEIYREAVKINDKSALSDYSEITYNQLERRSGTIIDNTTTIYVGVKVIKPDGAVKEINADDIILTKDEKKSKEAKLAVPDLQVGDIVDYFIAKQTNMLQVNNLPPYVFAFFENYPIMSYTIHAEIGKKYAIEYHAYNGAEEFKESKGEDGDNVLDVKKLNIPSYSESNLWISPYRQLPIIRMNILLGKNGRAYEKRYNARKPGEIYKNQPLDEFLQDEKIGISAHKLPNARSMIMIKDYSGVPSIASDYFKKLQRNKDDIPADSVATGLFYMYRFSNYLDFDAYNSIDGILNRNYKNINTSLYMYDFGDFLKLAHIDNSLVFITPKDGPVLKEIMGSDDINYLLLVQGKKPQIFGMEDIFTLPFYVPSRFENTRQAITLDIKGRTIVKPKDFDQGVIDVPGSKAMENLWMEKLAIIPSLSGSTLQVNRTTILKGHYKSDLQKRLILIEDYCNAERKAFGADKTIVEELQKDKKTRKFADELKTAFDQQRLKQKDAFVSEAKNNFDLDIADLTDYKIDNPGIRHTSPDFMYSSKFKINDIVKKAGNNFIIEVGKLQGSPLKISATQRKRTLDIYMPFARGLQTEITMQIPDGYSVDGVSALNKKVENEAGYFICDAKVEGSNVVINVSKVYNNAFEPAANWDKLLAFIDAANDWTNSKLLLKKK